ncbi:MAG: hypothetical protein A3E78_01430 [Alphaproteobacteria bacterium RIFCSPHIGHO2_12_FULL_63_12]|nr:MAG: hypothetical protein A3E78_01430 [Alphaproteobacteria bacterium RIFCSPHIGHO2_12_FULL_63_12]
MKWAVRIVSIAAIGLALAIVVAGPGTRFGLWDYGTGLSLIRNVSAPKEIFGGVALPPLFTAAALALILGLVSAFMRQRGAAALGIIAALVAGASGFVPIKMKAAFEGNPFIHEVTTDFDNPPAIVAAANEPRKNPAEYRGMDKVPNDPNGLIVADAQRLAFPDIAPILAEADLTTATAVAKDVVTAMGMKILADGPADNVAGGGWRIEAVATSFWFGFKDDFIVRLTPMEDGRTKIDLRSKSRVGGSDLGANAARVRDFMERFNAAI